MTGNCNIYAEQKILVMNETKRYEIWQKKNFCNLPKFVIESEKNIIALATCIKQAESLTTSFSF